MAAHFRMRDLGALSNYLGIEVRQGKEALTLGQNVYALKLLERSSMAECKLCISDGGATEADEGQYRDEVHTRPDIAFVVGYVSRFMEDPKEDHWAAVKQLLRYIKRTVDQEIVFPKTGGNRLQLTVFSDAE
ncbi:uncharacterized mitochondrial protein AtMg00810-like [Miscanthus floridulus]|uniref:uncharacterized mitochondrial protein AtMg00810-like n=1 Tax=Miscanthus floridulus TaxID=154761 RepID=UPI00345A471B